jgi:small neutral amino acid transporter SnatA (MarC family)
VLSVLSVTALIFATGAWLFARAPEGSLRVLTRVVGILLTAIAVDLVLDGPRSFYQRS